MPTLLSATVGLVSGIFLRSFVRVDLVFGGALFLVAILILVLVYRFRPAFFVWTMIFMCSTGLGILRTALTDTSPPQTFLQDVGKRVSYDGMVTDDPDVRDASQRVSVRVTKSRESVGVLVIAKRFPKVSAGDLVHVSGTLALPQNISSDDGRTFRYDKYLEKNGIRFTLNFASISETTHGEWWLPETFFAKLKNTFLAGIDAALSEPYAALAGGIVIGGKQGLGTDLLHAFSISGLVQIVVLSGYNVMIVAETVMVFLAYLKLSRKVAGISGALALAFFVAISGAGAATLRAAFMALTALYAKSTGRTYDAGRALLCALDVMLLWNPLSLAFDPGFDLSVVATAGLIWLATPIEARLMWIKNEFWRTGVSTTLAAQIAVLPLLLYETGTLSLVAVPANLLTLPVMPAAMAAAAIAGLSGLVLGPSLITTFIGFPAYVLTAYLIWVAKTAASLPFSAFAIPAFPFWAVLISYAALIYIASSKRFSITPQFIFSKNASM